MALAERAYEAGKLTPRMTLWKVIKDLWDPQTNPDGFVSLGVAENALMHQKLNEHIHANMNLDTRALTYGDGGAGSKRVKEALSTFLTQRLKPVTPIKPEHVHVTNGCTTAIEHLSWALANPGDGILLGQPYYGAFITDIEIRPEVNVVKVPFHDVDPFSMDAVQKYEDQILTFQRKGQRIAGLMLCHPHNPLGRCYPRDVLIALMRLCQKYQIHFISDEIYAFSVWKNTIDSDPAPVPYESALSIPLTSTASDGDKILDPSLLHFIWGASKDFGANGIRIGAIFSQHNAALMEALVAVAIYSYASSLSEHVLANILEDTAFVDAYMAENQRLLSEHHAIATNFVREQGIDYKPGANAAFFLWVNLGKKYKEMRPHRTEHEEEDITSKIDQALLKNKVFLASAANFGGEEPGWFRIVFSQPKDILEEGLRRMMKSINGDGEQEVASGVESLKV